MVRLHRSPLLWMVTLSAGAFSLAGCYRHATRDAPSSPPSQVAADEVAVPPGTFTQGDNTGEPDEYPERRVRVSGFRIDRTEVSNAAYKACVEARACDPSPLADHEVLGKPEHPVVGVTWEDARAYCVWVGKRLPTEAEWEYAAKGSDLRKWPWTGRFAPDFANSNHPEDGYPLSAPVEAFPAGASPFGALNLAGNVAEWVADFYDPTLYRTEPGEVADPQGPATGRERAVRGGSYADSQYLTRVSARAAKVSTQSDNAVGFRCARDG